MDDADAALEKFFEEDALLEALQDAPDMEAQAEVFKVPKPSTAAPAAPAAEVTPVAGTSGTAALGSAARARRTEEAMSTLEIEKPGPATRAPVPRAKAGRSWTGTMLVVCISLSIWLLILWLWNGTDENELWPAPAPSHSQAPPKIQPVDPVDSKHWQVIFKDEETNVRMEYLPSKYIPGGATYRARAVMEMPLSVEDALMCFMDFSKKKLNYARDYKDISVDKVLKHTGQLPGNLPEESIVTVTLNFSGFLWIVKPFFPASITLHLSVEEDVNCPGQYHWMQESLGPDGRPDGRTKKGGSIEAHPSGEKGKCMLASLSEVPSWFPVWVMKYSAPKIKTYLSEYTGRYLEYKKTLQ